jgi:hypothetical protein
MEKLIELPAWAVADAAAFRRLAARVRSFEFIRAGVAVPRCGHGCNPFTDSCPNCDNKNEGN